MNKYDKYYDALKITEKFLDQCNDIENNPTMKFKYDLVEEMIKLGMSYNQSSEIIKSKDILIEHNDFLTSDVYRQCVTNLALGIKVAFTHVRKNFNTDVALNALNSFSFKVQ